MLGWSRRRSLLVSSGQRPGRKGRPRSSRGCLPKNGVVQEFCPTCQQTGQPARVAWALGRNTQYPRVREERLQRLMGDADVPRHMLHHSGCATKRHPGACGPMWSLSQREAVSRAKVPTASTGLRNGPEKSGQGNMFLARPARPARGTYRRVCLPRYLPSGDLEVHCVQSG
uniref:Unnamed protein product n=1 Tax=Macaca fascicularis TaxID=9541 RepID=Q9N0E0_MACFA|nr:unnamed protein product [Macaca fascicularis]